MHGVLRQNDLILCMDGCSGTPKCPDGRVMQGSSDTFVDNRPVARSRDTTTNCCGSCCPCPNKVITGSSTVFVNNQQLAHKNSTITRGRAITFSATVFIG